MVTPETRRVRLEHLENNYVIFNNTIFHFCWLAKTNNQYKIVNPWLFYVYLCTTSSFFKTF
jgi:hypothetical protein